MLVQQFDRLRVILEFGVGMAEHGGDGIQERLLNLVPLQATRVACRRIQRTDAPRIGELEHHLVPFRIDGPQIVPYSKHALAILYRRIEKSVHGSDGISPGCEMLGDGLRLCGERLQPVQLDYIGIAPVGSDLFQLPSYFTDCRVERTLDLTENGFTGVIAFQQPDQSPRGLGHPHDGGHRVPVQGYIEGRVADCGRILPHELGLRIPLPPGSFRLRIPVLREQGSGIGA